MSSYAPSSSMLNHTISISISDDESDNLSSTSRLLRSRRKRKRPVFQRKKKKNEILRRAVRIIVKWWMLLLFLPAIAFLIYEASRIGERTTTHEVERPEFVERKKLEGNLNRLDHTTRMVHGVRERCLKILPLDELQYLDIPSVGKPSFPVERVVYVSETNRSHNGGNTTLPEELTEATRFNMFTGYQTLQEREQSYKVNEPAVVHCGFYSENGGFKVSDEDKNYMQTCEVVVSTCAFGGGDDLYQPIGMSEASLRKVCYVAFWDEITLKTQESQGRRIDENYMIGKWRIVVVRELPFVDQRLNGKIPKMLGHRLFPRARYSIWVDSKSQFRRDPLGVLEALLLRTNSVLAISEHGARSSIYDEGNAVVKKHKATPEEVEVQLSQYRRDGFPDEKRFNGKKALAEASVILREHTPLTNLFMCLWFNEVVRFTSR
ncbi:hypothetical protein L1049_015089 [Liquidambar formosana]|uniref:TOD1/MUCI70 glycosyltransferase-like domain-containing protein n=1 Tax=Liquidambar formosana TaxID=63359 RepID=A0AAP0X1N0_LIQFO